MMTPAILIVSTMLNTLAREYHDVAKQRCIQFDCGQHADMPNVSLTLALCSGMMNITLVFVVPRATLAQQLLGTMLNIAPNLDVIANTRIQ